MRPASAVTAGLARHDLDRHVEGEFEFVARVPVALKSDVAVFGSGGNRFAVQREPEGTAPAGNPQRESEVSRRLDRDRDFAAEGIAAADFDSDAVPVDAARRRNIQPEFVFRFRPREGAELRQEPAEAGRAARSQSNHGWRSLRICP